MTQGPNKRHAIVSLPQHQPPRQLSSSAGSSTRRAMREPAVTQKHAVGSDMPCRDKGSYCRATASQPATGMSPTNLLDKI